MRKVLAAVSTAMVTLVGGAQAAFAQTSPLDGVSTEVNSSKDTLISFVTGTGVPVLFALLILGVGIGLAVRYTRRGARSA